VISTKADPLGKPDVVAVVVVVVVSHAALVLNQKLFGDHCTHQPGYQRPNCPC